MKRKLRLIFYPFWILLLLLAGGGYFFLHTGTALHLVVNSLRQGAFNVFGSELTADGWQGDLLHGLTVTNLAVRKDGRQWLAVKKVDIRFDAFPMLLGLMHVKSVILEDPDLSLSIDEAGNIVMPMKARSTAIPFGLGWRGLGRVDHFSVNNGSVRFYDNAWEKLAGREFTGLRMNGKAGFSALPGTTRWSAWVSASAGSVFLASEQLRIAFAASRISLHPDRLEGRDLHLKTGQSDMQGDLVLPYDSKRPFSLRWQNTTLSLRDLGLESDRLVLSSGSLVSQPPPPELTSVQSQPGRPLSHPYKLRQNLEFEGHRFEIEGIIERPFSDRFTYQGGLRFSGIDSALLTSLFGELNMQSAVDRLRKVAPLSNLDGSLYIDVAYKQGTRQWRGTLNLEQGRVGAMRLQQVHLPFVLLGKTMRFKNSRMNTESGGFIGDLTVSLDGSEPLLLAHGKIENFRPAFLPKDILSGQALAANIDLTLEQTGDTSFKGKIEPVRILGQRITGGGFAGSSKGDTVTLRQLSVSMEKGGVLLTARKIKDNLKATFRFDQVPAQLLLTEGEGVLSGEGTIEKAADSPYILTLNLPRVKNNDLQLTDLAITLPFAGEKAEQRAASFRVHAGEALWRRTKLEDLNMAGKRRGLDFEIAAGTVRFAEKDWKLAGPAALRLTDSGFSLADCRLAAGRSVITASLLKSGEKINGRLSAEKIMVPQNLPLPPIVDLREVLFDLTLSVDGLVSQPAITFTGKALTAKPDQDAGLNFKGRLADNRLQIDGALRIAKREMNFGLQMPASISLAPFHLNYDLNQLAASSSLMEGKLSDIPFLSVHDCDGQVQLQMRMAERNQRTDRLSGRLFLQEANCRIPDTDLVLEEGQLLFHAGKDRLILEPSEITTNQGKLELRGEMAGVLEYPEVNGFLEVSSDGVTVNYRGIYDASLSGMLRVDVAKGKRSLQGELTVLSADLKQPMQAAGFDRTDNTVIYASRTATDGIRRTDFLEEVDRLICGTSLDVMIYLPEKVALHAGALSLELEGALHAGGDGSGLEIEGRLKAIDGSYSVAGREFKVEEGEVVFTRENGLDPRIDGAAVCRMPDITVTAKVKGSVEKPSVLLESDPWLKEDEIKSAIVFGKPVSDLTSQEKNQFDSSVATLLGGTVLSRFKAMTGNQALLDSFSFYTDEQSGAESVAVGKYLTDDLLFSYRQGVKESNAGEVRVEYKLKGGFSVESLYSDEGEKSGFDFFWSKDF